MHQATMGAGSSSPQAQPTAKVICGIEGCSKQFAPGTPLQQHCLASHPLVTRTAEGSAASSSNNSRSHNNSMSTRTDPPNHQQNPTARARSCGIDGCNKQFVNPSNTASQTEQKRLVSILDQHVRDYHGVGEYRLCQGNIDG